MLFIQFSFSQDSTTIQNIDKNWAIQKIPTVLESNDVSVFNKKNIANTDVTRMSLDKSEKPIYMMQGKKVGEFELNGIDPKDIEKLQMYKGETAIMRYGEEAKNGAIVITLKKK